MAPPQTPGHSRQTTVDFASTTSSPQQRRQSRSSLQDPTTPIHQSFNHDSLDMFSSGGMGTSGGIANLADELADAYSDDDDEYYEQDAPDISFDAMAQQAMASDGQRDSGVDVGGGSPAGAGKGQAHAKNASLSLPAPTNGRHKRAGSEYDGSEYGSESDLDSPGMPPGLVAKMDAVESLARRGTENNGGPTDGVFKRVTQSLRDLGSQAGVEGGASRLITAHSALTTHLAHQGRQLQNLAFPLVSPLAAPPDPEVVEGLLPVLLALQSQMPRPSRDASDALTALRADTGELVHALSVLSDTLHMSRQTTITATRRLKSARELVADMRHDEELREQGERWIDRGDWDDRLRRRDCAAECRSVVSDFEAEYNRLRAGFLKQVGAAQA